MFSELISFIVELVATLGYLGIFIMMFLESSLFPFPSEVVMVPAGYLASKGEMDLFMAIFYGVAGSLFGALFNYYLALKLGRPFIQRYGKYILIKEETLQKMDSFFAKHGHISTFSGRLIPVVRQYISLPAGISRMNLLMFSIYTSLGAGIWVTVLALVGFYIGENEALVKSYLTYITITILATLLLSTLIYLRLKVKKEIIK